MASLSTESTPRERLARLIVLVKRTRMFWRSTAAILVIGVAVSLVLALNSKRAWRSETTVLYRSAIQTKNATESAAARSARLGPQLKDLLYARPRLEQVIREYDLFPEKQKRSMLDALEEMQAAVTFRARAGDSFVIAFTYEDPVVAQEVTARLTDRMIEEYNRQNIDTATLTRDFLQRELEEANTRVDDASRALSTFLASHPQFQWGLNDSPYAPVPAGPLAPAARLPGPARPLDPVLSDRTVVYLLKELARIDAQLAPATAPAAPGPAREGSPITDAQKHRDAAAAALSAAQTALAERLAVVTPAHPDAITAQARVDAARQALAAAESALQKARVGAPPDVLDAPVDPARRAELEKQRARLQQQLAERRGRLAGAPPAPPAPSASVAHAAAPPAPSAPAPTVIDLETDWHRLRTELERARDQLRIVQANAHDAAISADAVEKQSQEEMQILEPAYRPTKPDRGRGRVFFAGATIALFLALGYAGARVLLNDTLLDEGDVSALGGPPMLVTLPELPAPPKPAPRTMVPTIGRDSDPDEASPFPAPPRPAAGRPAVEVAAEPPPAPREAPIAPVVPEPSPAPPAAHRRDAAVTIRFGHPLPSAPAAAALEPVSAGALALARDYPRIEAIFEDPDVEVIGADVDPAGGEGAFGLLRGASPAALGALRVLRHRLEQKRGDEPFVVSVVSPGAGEGKTLLACQLAMTLSESERSRVVLVEGNLERPRVAATLGLRLPESAGFSAQVRRHMNGRVRPWGVVRLGPSLTVLAEPGIEAAYPAALHSTHFETALAALRRENDYVVIDGPSILGSGDANVIEGVSTGVLLVARAASTRGAALARATQQLGDRRILGVVLNGVVQPERTSRPAKKDA